MGTSRRKAEETESEDEKAIHMQQMTPMTGPSDSHRGRPRTRPALAYWSDEAKEFCGDTSIHGLRYLTQKNRIWERLFWLAWLVAAIVVCTIMLQESLSRWRSSPFVLALDVEQRPVWEVPIPAITICPENKIPLSKFNFTDVFLRSKDKNATAEELDIAADLLLQCDIEWGKEVWRNDSVVDRIEYYSSHISDLFIDKEIGDLFQPVITEDGLCFTSNMLPASRMFPKDTFYFTRGYLNSTVQAEWSLDGGYPPSAGASAYPRRALSSGTDGGIRIGLRTYMHDIEPICKSLIEGFKVQLHSPSSFPRPGQFCFRAPLNSVIDVAVSPNQIITDETIKGSYSVDQRSCYFPDERPLRYFLEYNQPNCNLECLANITLHMCKCVAFHMPRDPGTVVCGAPKRQCMKDARMLFQTHESGLKNDTAMLKYLPGHIPQCKCLPNCVDILYNNERSQSVLNLDILSDDLKRSKESKLTIISIFFKHNYFIPIRRVEMYESLQFYANCGGILGLFLGISVLSLFEILYYLVLRPCFRFFITNTSAGDN